MGDSCYMSSVIQALSKTKFLAFYIHTNKYYQHINKYNTLGYGDELAMKLALLSKALLRAENDDKHMKILKTTLASKKLLFDCDGQQDSHEFMLFLLDGLHEDLNKSTWHAKVEPLEDTERVDDVKWAIAQWNAHMAINNSVIVDMFHGQYRSAITCDHCKTFSATFDIFVSLSLPLVTTGTSCSLDVSVSCVCVSVYRICVYRGASSCSWPKRG